MIWTNLKRITKSGFVNFWRNGYVSFASIVVMVVTLFVISSIIFAGSMLTSVLDTLRDKVDVNIYFLNEATEDDVMVVKKHLEALPEVAMTEYISREDALANFELKHQNDEIIMQTLDELGENPLGAVLTVKAKETSQYESIAAYLKSETDSRGNEYNIEKVTYYQNKDAIDALTKIIEASRKLGSIVTIIFVLLSIVITFNTIRLAIYVSREEISVMKLVGASFMYIRGPFVVGGIMSGALSAVITLIVLYPITYWMGPSTERLFAGINIFEYYISNFPQIFIIILASGVGIGAVSSYLAVRKYLAN